MLPALGNLRLLCVCICKIPKVLELFSKKRLIVECDDLALVQVVPFYSPTPTHIENNVTEADVESK